MAEVNVDQAVAEYRRKKDAERVREYYRTHREQKLEYNRKWRKANKEKMRAYNRAYYWRQKEQAAAELEAARKQRCD